MSELDEVPARRYLQDRGRRTRIVVTIGPASDAPEVLARLVEAGMDVARLPLAHSSLDQTIARLRRVRAAAPGVGVLIDLPGPKIRTTPLPEGGVTLATGSVTILQPAPLAPRSDSTTIGISPSALIDSLQEGDPLVLGDGTVTLVVGKRDGLALHAQVVSGGRLQGRPGVTAPASRLVLESPTRDDLEQLEGTYSVNPGHLGGLGSGCGVVWRGWGCSGEGCGELVAVVGLEGVEPDGFGG